jgi:hypothetical protein
MKKKICIGVAITGSILIAPWAVYHETSKKIDSKKVEFGTFNKCKYFYKEAKINHYEVSTYTKLYKNGIMQYIESNELLNECLKRNEISCMGMYFEHPIWLKDKDLARMTYGIRVMESDDVLKTKLMEDGFEEVKLDDAEVIKVEMPYIFRATHRICPSWMYIKLLCRISDEEWEKKHSEKGSPIIEDYHKDRIEYLYPISNQDQFQLSSINAPEYDIDNLNKAANFRRKYLERERLRSKFPQKTKSQT